MSKKILRIVVAVIAVIACITTIVYAGTITINLVATPLSVARGEQTTITLSAADINIINGLYGVSGKIEFDENVFEPITADAFTLGTGWATPSYNESGTNKGSFEIQRTSSPITQNTDIFKLPLKVKANATVGSTTIKITGIKAANSEPQGSTNDDEVTVTDKTIAVTITAPEVGGFNVVNNNVNNTNNSSTFNTATNNTNTNTVAATSIPKTGLSDYAFPVIAMLAIIVVISYVKYKKVI